jgi:hypothetical protein
MILGNIYMHGSCQSLHGEGFSPVQPITMPKLPPNSPTPTKKLVTCGNGRAGCAASSDKSHALGSNILLVEWQT